MNIAGLNKAKVLAALYNRARPIGRSVVNYDSIPMIESQAQKILDDGKNHFDYLGGRVMKIDLSEDDVDTFLYNRDHGKDAAEMAVLDAEL